MAFYVWVGKWSDRVGRKKPIILGNILILLAIFPAFWALGNFANPKINESAKAAPAAVAGTNCDFDPFASQQTTMCGRLLQDLTSLGVPYDAHPMVTPIDTSPDAPAAVLTVGETSTPLPAGLFDDNEGRMGLVRQALTAAGYDFSVQYPGLVRQLGIVAMLMVFGLLSALNYGSVAALLAEMFPAKIRYSSMSIPYHIGAGYFGGFLPVIAGYIVARTGDVYAGLWYTWAFVAIALVVGWWGIPSGPPRDFADEIA